MSAEVPHAEGASKLGTAAALRRLFDETFAAPAASGSERLQDLLAIRTGSDPYALRLSEIAGLHADLKIVPVPSPAALLLGIVGIRGTMAPIYDLAGLLGYPAVANPRWIVFARGRQAVGFGFEDFESHLQVSDALLVQSEGEVAGIVVAGQHLRGTVRVGGVLRPIIHMASIVAMLGGPIT
jgi:chemotaxis signal transduction protein